MTKEGMILTKKPALRAVTACRSTFAHCSIGIDLCPAIPACCCSCFRQCLLAAYPADCLLSTGCRTDQRHDRRIADLRGNQWLESTVTVGNKKSMFINSDTTLLIITSKHQLYPSHLVNTCTTNNITAQVNVLIAC